MTRPEKTHFLSYNPEVDGDVVECGHRRLVATEALAQAAGAQDHLGGVLASARVRHR